MAKAGFGGHVVGWVVIDYFSFSIVFFVCFVCFWGVGEFGFIAAFFEGFFVFWCCCFEYLFIAGDCVEASVYCVW